MSGLVPVCLPLARIAALALVFASEARSQDKGPPSAVPAANEGGLGGAKKEFENLTSAPDAAWLPKSGLPRMVLPELPAQGPATTPATSPKTPPREVKRGNWLVEAMEKEGKSRDVRKADPRSRERVGKPASGQGFSSVAADDPSSSTDRRQEKNADAPSQSAVVNPLSQFLGDWMTPQDYALLKGGTGRPFDARADTTTSDAVGAPGMVSAATGLNEYAFRGLPAPALGTKPPLRENPYLESLNRDSPSAATAGSTKTFSMRPSPPPITVITPAIIPPSPKPVPPTSVPEFAKPQTDDRYFKQLKRF